MTDNLYSTLLQASPFFLIAGPCVIEDEKTMMETAEFLTGLASKLHLPLVYKSSFLKANRTSQLNFTGPGLDAGLKLLQKVKTTFDIPILTDVHETTEVASATDVCDIIQIPAFLSRQTALLQAAGQSGRIVNIKKAQFMAPEDMEHAAGKVLSQNNQKIILTERGTSFGYHNLVVDFRSFAILKALGYPVVYDVTHSLQKPSTGVQTGGTPQFAGMMAQAAIATGMVNGLFIETHPNPTRALSDAATMLPLNQITQVIENCMSIKHSLDDHNE